MSLRQRRVAWLVLGLIGPLRAEPVVLSDCESVTGWTAQAPATVAAAADAAVGQGAVQIGLPGTVARTLAPRATAAMAAWDRYQGLSFRVKGDGSANFGCLAVGGGGSDSGYSYVAWFPLRDTTWHTVTVGWADLVPEGPCDPIGSLGALPPSGITQLRCGSRWTIGHNNYPLPRVSFGLDQIQLEEAVPPPPAAPDPAPFAQVVAKLKAGEPVRIVCMGDSITAGTSLPDRDHQRYAVLVERRLRDWLRNEQITCESRAVGGARLTDARAWVPRDFVGPPPDLITVLYGYNDKSGTQTRDYYQRSLTDYLARLARATEGRSAILLLTCLPGTGPRWSMLDDFADAVRETARTRGLACFDLQGVMKSLGREGIEPFFADQAHPNVAGHERLADALARYLATAAGVTPPAP
jgi:lysophospholipase L1-like esterase